MSDSSENNNEFGLPRKSELLAPDALKLAAMDVAQQRTIVASEVMPSVGQSWGNNVSAPSRNSDPTLDNDGLS